MATPPTGPTGPARTGPTGPTGPARTGPTGPTGPTESRYADGSTDDHASLPRAEFAFPGPLRDRLVGAILAGAKRRDDVVAV